MEGFLIRLLVTIGSIWLTQTLLDAFGIAEPARKIVYIVVIIVSVLWLIGYGFYF